MCVLNSMVSAWNVWPSFQVYMWTLKWHSNVDIVQVNMEKEAGIIQILLYIFSIFIWVPTVSHERPSIAHPQILCNS